MTYAVLVCHGDISALCCCDPDCPTSQVQIFKSCLLEIIKRKSMDNTIMNVPSSKCEAVKNWKIKDFKRNVSLESLRYRITKEGQGRYGWQG